MPLIRYQIEDTGMLLSKTCSCGRSLPLMQMPSGRITDFVVTPEGRIVSGVVVVTYLVAHAPGVGQAQLIQDDISHIVLRIVRGPAFGDASLDYFAGEMPKFFGNNMSFDIEYADSISNDPSGKFRFSISKIDPMEYLV
jgi:phenylacetate-CoA ligase